MPETTAPRDSHSYSNPAQVRTSHLHLDLTADFERKALIGSVTLTLEFPSEPPSRLTLDTRDLTIHRVEAAGDDGNFQPTEYRLGERDSALGSPLDVTLPDRTTQVRLNYESDPGASGVQWLDPAQTAGKSRPFLFTQSQAIHARSWIPCQDTPGVRSTYSAVIHTPPDLRAVMSAEMDADAPRTGEYHFDMPQPIPSYLIALAVGDIVFEAVGPRTGVYAEPGVVAAAAREFEDLEAMMRAVENLYGPYRWGRYDVLVLPPSFPYGGMENPRLTFATPTLLAGDKSLVGVISHELAHSWSGNLVSNATWRDLWLNEGFTVYLEYRIQEVVFDGARAEMENVIEVQALEQEMKTLEPRDQILHINLDGRDPDDGATLVPYVKGMMFLLKIETLVGRERFDRFLRAYFDHFAFQSIVTDDFLAYLRRELPEAFEQLDIAAWIDEPGMPSGAVYLTSDAFAKVEAERDRWLAGQASPQQLQTEGWTTPEWLHLLSNLPEDLDAGRMAELDGAFGFTRSGNSEIVHRWLLESLRRGYHGVDARLEEFLLLVGRRKYLKPLYEELVKSSKGRERAMRIYSRARPGYHPIAQATIDQIVATPQQNIAR